MNRIFVFEFYGFAVGAIHESTEPKRITGRQGSDGIKKFVFEFYGFAVVPHFN